MEKYMVNKKIKLIIVLFIFTCGCIFSQETNLGSFFGNKLANIELYYMPMNLDTWRPLISDDLVEDAVLAIEIRNDSMLDLINWDVLKTQELKRSDDSEIEEMDLNIRVVLKLIFEDGKICTISIGKTRNIMKINDKYFLMNINIVKMIAEILPKKSGEDFLSDIESR